jgi:acetyl-CoA synthetase
MWQVMPDYDSYERARADFSWDLPDRHNTAVDRLRKHDSGSLALIDAATDDRYTYGDLDAAASRLADAFEDLGVEPGDRVGVIAPQRYETPVAHAACWLVGAVTVPLTTLFGQDALSYRLDDAGAEVAVFDPTVRESLAAASADCGLDTAVELAERPYYAGEPEPETGEIDAEVLAYDDLLAGRPTTYEAYDATPGTDAALLYTSGSTGPPKGVRHGHALWLGRAAAAYNFFDGNLGPAAVCWTPADWAWGSALGGLLLGTWHYGGTVVAAPMQGFDPAAAFDLLDAYDVTGALVPPTALRMMMNEEPPADLALETVASAGEPVTPEILDWAGESLDGVAVNEYYGQTELNLVVANASRWFEVQPGSMGRPLPGYEVTILDPDSREELPAGEVGEIAVKPGDDRVFLKEYWNRPDATEAKTHDEWYLTDDLARMDEAGYLWFESRADDVIITSGYRVGPLEVEQALLGHPAVEQVGVIGVPDDTRGEIIKAYVELTPGNSGDDGLREQLRERARERLAEYEYPREIEFVDSLPKTSSGKIRRVELREGES